MWGQQKLGMILVNKVPINSQLLKNIMQKLPSSCTFSVTQTSLNKQSQNSIGTKRLHINLLSLYRLQFFVFLDVDYKELVDESTRLYSKYEDPKELNDKEKKRLKNLTFISWRASLICQYKFEIFKVLDHPARAFAWIDLASKLFSHLIFDVTSYLR